jgi:hypothetical protein
MAAAARVHRRDQLKARRIGDVPLSTGDADAAGLERLAQRLERSAIEFGQFVEEQIAYYTFPPYLGISSPTGARDAGFINPTAVILELHPLFDAASAMGR